MPDVSAYGYSIIETLVGLALVACVSAALPPALSLASRLQRESAFETQAAVIAAGRMEWLKADVAAGRAQPGGALDAALAGFHARVDGDGAEAPIGVALFDCRWRVEPAAAPAGALILSVRVAPLSDPFAAVTISTAVPDG